MLKIALIILVIFFSQETFAKDNLPKCFKKFTLSYFDFGFFYNTMKDTGIDKDLVDELKKRSHCQFDLSVMMRARIWKSIENGDLDFSVAALETPERTKFAYFVNYIKFKNFVLIRKEVKKKGMQDFMANPTLRFGVVRSYKHGSDTLENIFLKKLHQEGRVDEVPDQARLFTKLNSNGVQAIFSPIVSYKMFFKVYKDIQKKVDIVDWIPNEKPMKSGIIMSKKVFSQVEADKWRALIDQIRLDGTMKKIFNKYFSKEDAEALCLK